MNDLYTIIWFQAISLIIVISTNNIKLFYDYIVSSIFIS